MVFGKKIKDLKKKIKKKGDKNDKSSRTINGTNSCKNRIQSGDALDGFLESWDALDGPIEASRDEGDTTEDTK
ncbi:hypothetical protein QTG54_002216 [Skeletonema marinoi]|uniref:Uncharacterized protein n=1 Tax=Skeletonema marinoi TaxID=267567 RepID=A0AAD8YKD9_9STRA|nr:hypothetical protein QTG54_002216 [Skeletonema marinoi]